VDDQFHKTIHAICMYFIHSEFDKTQSLVSKLSIEDIPKIRTKKLVPLLYYTLTKSKEQSNPEFANAIRKVMNQTWHSKIVKQIQISKEVQLAFAKEKIPVVSYKGLTFTRQFYPNVRYRNSIDVDLAIQYKHLERIGPIMKGLGFVEAKGQNDYEDLKSSRGYYIDYSWLLYENGKPVCNVELHWQVANSALYVPLIFDDIFDKQILVQVKQKPIRSFKKVYQALLVVIHHGIVDGWGKHRHLVDLTQIDKILDHKEWQSFIDLTKQYKVYHCLATGISICNKYFNYTFENTTDEFPNTKVTRKIIPLLDQDALSGKWSEQPKKLWYYLQMRDSFSDTIKSAVQFGSYTIKEMKFKRAAKKQMIEK